MNSMLEEWASVMRELSAKMHEYERESRALGDKLQTLREKRRALGALQSRAVEALHCAALGTRQPDGATPNCIRTDAMAIDG
jgi:hypothetical protein